VSTISLEEAKQLYAARAVLEGFAGRECARLHDPAVVRRIGDALTKLKAAFAEGDLLTALKAKTEFYAALIDGCQNTFIERMLRPLHDRITLLRITSMSQPKRINKSLREVTAIWRAIQNGDPDLAEQCCVDHIKAADVIARLLGSSMSATLKQPIVIENVVGAGGTIGTNRVAKAAPDGYTLLLMHVGQATAPALYAKLPFDPVSDFAPIGLVTDVPMI